MRVRVLFFAGLRERAGAPSADLELPVGATVETAMDSARRATPRQWKVTTRIMTAVNEEYVPVTHELKDGDELALIPPVSGGTSIPSDHVEITTSSLDPLAFSARVRDDTDGAIVTFEGVTRNHNEGRKVLYLEYEAYRPMADRKIA